MRAPVRPSSRSGRRRRRPPRSPDGRSARGSAPRRSSGPPSRSSPPWCSAGVLLNLVSSQSDPTQHVGVLPETAAVSEQLVATGTVTGDDDRDAGGGVRRRRVRSCSRTARSMPSCTSTDPLTVVVHTKLPDMLAPVFASLAQQEALSSAVTDLGGDPGEVGREIAQATPDITALEPEPEQDGAQIVAGFVAGILLFISLMTAGQLVAQGVVEEKGVARRRAAAGHRAPVAADGRQGAGHRGHRAHPGGARRRRRLRDRAGPRTRGHQLDQPGRGPRCGWWIWFVIGFTMYALALGCAGRAGVAAGGRRLGDRAGADPDDDPVHHRREHRPLGPDEPPGRVAVLRPVLLAPAHADADRPRRGRRVGGRAGPRAVARRDPCARLAGPGGSTPARSCAAADGSSSRTH